MAPSVCCQVEASFRDSDIADLLRLPPVVVHSFRLHQINAFGYRSAWAEGLLAFVKISPEGKPYFPLSPDTPEAHRHKFLTALTLSEHSPGEWEIGGKKILAKDFVEAILESPVKAWGDNSIVPEPSWTLQFLSTFLDEAGNWRQQATPLAQVTQDFWDQYCRDFASGDLWQPGKTPFTETGLHFLEALNKLSARQKIAKLPDFSTFKSHLWARLQKSLEETSVLLSHPSWMEHDFRIRLLEIAFTQLLVLGHLLEICFHPKGVLRNSWDSSEINFLNRAATSLETLMLMFFDPRVLGLMNDEQKRSYPFPMLHAYHALIYKNDWNG